MPRKKLIRSHLYPYHVYNRTIDQNFYSVDMEVLWNKCCDLLRITSWAYNIKIHAFVLMSNHYHMLCTTPDRNLDDAIGYFQSELSIWIHNTLKIQSLRFSGPYKWSIITNSSHYFNVYRYIYQNPIRAFICNRAEEYQYSLISGRAGNIENFPPFHTQDLFQFIVPENIQDELKEINFILNNDENEKTRKALKHSFYRYPKQKRRGAGVQKLRSAF